MRAVSDEQLIYSVADGDPSCLGTLFERHHVSVYRYCLQLTGHAAHSEDLVQDVFLKMLEKAKSFRGEGSFKAWMFNIARNLTFDYLRANKRRSGVAIDGDEQHVSLIDHCNAEQSAAGIENLHVLTRVLSSLSAAAQEVIWLGRFEFDSYEELGRALDCKPGAARVRMHRAMKELSTAFEHASGVSIDV